MTDEDNSGLGAGLLEFLEWAGRTGEMNSTTADSWATAVRSVLQLEGDPDAVDVRAIDVDALLDRFETKNRTKYSEGSMATYRSRFRRAVTAYLAWMNGEPWKGGTRVVKRKKTLSKPTSMAPSSDSPTAAEPPAATVPVPQHGTTARLVPYTVPLRPDLMVTMALPVDLTVRDAERIATFVRSLAFDPESGVDEAPSAQRSGGR